MTDQTPAAAADRLDPYAYMAAEFERNLSLVVAELRDTADALERMKAPARSETGMPGFGSEAAAAVAKVSNMMANLGLSALIRAGEQADHVLMDERVRAARD